MIILKIMNIIKTYTYVWNVKFTTHSGLKLGPYKSTITTSDNRFYKVDLYTYSGNNNEIRKHIYKLNNLIVKDAVKDYIKSYSEFTELLDYEMDQHPEFPDKCTIYDKTSLND